MSDVTICVGSNLKCRKERLEAARCWIDTILDNVRYSSIYETPEIHGIGRPYKNIVISGVSKLSLEDLIEKCKQFELQSGRTQEMRRRGDVPIDIDVVIWEGKIIRGKDFSQQFFQIGAKELGII